jgi:hypothetical protein
MLDFDGYVPSEPRGYSALGTGPSNRYYQASDGWFFLAVPERDRHKLAQVEGLGDDVGLWERGILEDPIDLWVWRFRQAGLSAQAVVHVKDLMVDPYVRQRGLSVSQQVDGVGETTAPGPSVRLSRTPMRIGEPRQPGGDATAILSELGMADELERLERAWVLQVHDLPAAW